MQGAVPWLQVMQQQIPFVGAFLGGEVWLHQHLQYTRRPRRRLQASCIAWASFYLLLLRQCAAGVRLPGVWPFLIWPASSACPMPGPSA